jgi:predicted nucleic acid-binding protein
MTMPSILVTDTNIWIDLENGEILTDIFRLPYQFITTDFAVGEFISPEWKTLLSLGLKTYPLEGEKILELLVLRQTYQQLSVVDLAALLLAKTMGVMLLTGDRNLNNLARTQGVSVHGVLWVLDEMMFHQILTNIQAAETLRKMLAQGARLPQVECQNRLDRWS